MPSTKSPEGEPSCEERILENPFDENDDEPPVIENSLEVDSAITKLEHLMNKVVQVILPKDLNKDIIAAILRAFPQKRSALVPGSYEHLFIILFETHEKLAAAQVAMEKWLRNRYPGKDFAGLLTSSTFGKSMAEQSYFTSEVEMLRKLLVPMRPKVCKY